MHCALKVGQKIRQKGAVPLAPFFLLFIPILANDISSERG